MKALSAPGFTPYGRINWTKETDDWLEANRALVLDACHNTKDHFQTEKLKWESKSAKLKYEELLHSYIPKEEAINTLQSISAAALALLRARLESELFHIRSKDVY